MVEALRLFLVQPFGMPLCKDKQSHLSQQVAEAVRLVGCTSHLGVELFSFRAKPVRFLKVAFCWPVYITSFFEGMEMLFEHTFVERRIVKIWRNNGVETFMLEF